MLSSTCVAHFVMIVYISAITQWEIAKETQLSHSLVCIEWGIDVTLLLWNPEALLTDQRPIHKHNDPQVA